MAGSTTTPTITLLLCLGLCWGLWDQVETGVYREPSLSAQPGPLVLLGGSLTLQCHSEPGFDRFALTKDEGPTLPPQHLHGQHSPSFALGPVNLSHGGQYRCYSGHNHSYVWSAPSTPLDILITGMSQKPSLSAQPGPSVPWGVKVTLQCCSEVRADTFHLHREGSLESPRRLRVQDLAAPFQGNFAISPVTSHHHGTYRCYSSHSSSPFQLSQPSDPLELLVSGLRRGPVNQFQAGVLPKPSVWADPGPIIREGSPVTIWCQGSLQADGYILYKDGVCRPLDTRIPQASSNKTVFLIQSMSSQNAGLYQCAYSTGGMLSERSEPLLLVVTGVYREPSLSAQPGPLVLPGENLTFQCHSEPGFDTFALTKDEGPTPPQSLQGQHSPNFPLGPVNLTHGGRYRCYSGHNLSYVWSAPSVPLDILITAYQPQDYTVGNLIRLGVSGLILVVLGVLLCEAWHIRRRPHNAASS